ncbi:MAG: gluconate 2-dehydrogenase subunit 3 family protein [Chitinophagaceae bacterium]
MKRRRFLSSIVLVAPVVITGTGVIFSSCKSDIKAEPFSKDDIKLLDEIGETIIPASASSPGAKAARIGEFMKVYVTDCYKAADQQVFSEGIISFKKLCRKTHGKEFLELSFSQKRDFLELVEKEAQENKGAKSEKKYATGNGDAVQTGKAKIDEKLTIKENTDHYFIMIKNITLLGYFTSEPGATKALRYIQTPGYFSGEIPYKKGDKSWAT